MAFSVTDLSPRIGSRIDTDLETMLSGEYAAEIREILERRGVIFFRGIDINDEQQFTFTRTFGEVYGDKSGDMYKVSFDKKESPKHWEYTYGTFSWHIDRTDTDIPPFATILTAKRLPGEGGQTQFANTYAAWEDLPQADKDLIDDLKVVHTVESSFRESLPNPTPEQQEMLRSHDPKVHPLVWHHKSGRNSLLTSTSAMSVVGMDEDEGRALLDRMIAWATQPQYVYSHEWQLGDIVMWDNTGVMHRVIPYPEGSTRLLHRTTVTGYEPFDTRKELELQ